MGGVDRRRKERGGVYRCGCGRRSSDRSWFAAGKSTEEGEGVLKMNMRGPFK
ncbi:hypothetical protein HanRHA438_Chr12g0568671 [Helianthus annuus]|uniref:Uncharacterized protein n=1 Tax=Helianthus annuus TaxID=4232 RepID=A0A9K3HJE0_HELAN|nr:hypothetical protein HanXRQr2_Chr12g0557241 [Helianthus annuus]KAJ0863992.1 hypothetical protein HanPSC8_Chr12g0536461 [Helianthus annuus]KAJ0867921.1 hypothetical protein HanRHA438_Chr12g0568671 [Helianthus annuus]